MTVGSACCTTPAIVVGIKLCTRTGQQRIKLYNTHNCSGYKTWHPSLCANDEVETEFNIDLSKLK